MSNLVIDPAYVLSVSDNGGDAPTTNNPVIGYDNKLVIGAVTADGGSNVSYPVTNLLNPATNSKWKGNTFGLQDILIGDGVLPITLDYIGIVKHNFYTGQIALSVESSSDMFAFDRTVLTSPVIPGNNGPMMFLFAQTTALWFRLRMATSVAFVIPEISVMYAGLSLRLQRRIYVGHTPINYGRSDNIVNGKSDSGNFLGRIVLGQNTASAISIKNMTPTWYRSTLDPFIVASKTIPFFFAWRPDAYPNEVGYCWMTNDPKPINQQVNGMMGIDLQFSGVV